MTSDRGRKRIAFISCPEWSVMCPPYNLSLLSAIVKQHGFESKIFDLNAECYQFLLKREGIDYWEGQNYFYWLENNFSKMMLPKIEVLVKKIVGDVIRYNPDFVGISLYDTNVGCTKEVIKRIRQKNKKIRIVIGGPQCVVPEYIKTLGIDYDLLFTGEAETTIVDALNNPIDQKIYRAIKPANLNELPPADYSDFNFDNYATYGVSAEASRGCVAKCSFCTETLFWKFRSKDPQKLYNELKEYAEKYNVKHIRFNDSLINGDMKQFKEFIEILSNNPLSFTWESYARIDKRMDYEFFKKIRKSKAHILSYGIESGSQKVLDDMRKNIKIETAERNLKDSKVAGVSTHVNWIVGFPTETPLDFLCSMMFIFNNRKFIDGISPGMTCGVSKQTELFKNHKKYDVLVRPLFRSYTTSDLKNTIIHRFLRLKFFHIFLNLLDINNGQYHQDIVDLYDFKGQLNNIDRIEYNECHGFDDLYKNTFESSLHCEYMAFFWGLFKICGPFEMKVMFNHHKDLSMFGDHLTRSYDVETFFKIDDSGNWNMQLKHCLGEEILFNEHITIKGKNRKVIKYDQSRLQKDRTRA